MIGLLLKVTPLVIQHMCEVRLLLPLTPLGCIDSLLRKKQFIERPVRQTAMGTPWRVANKAFH